MKTIVCPSHPNGKAHWYSLHRHQAILWEEGEQWPGIWECLITGWSDACEHENGYDTETFTTMYMRNGEADDYDTEGYVCVDCRVAIDPDVANPEEDRAEALADMQIMEALGK